MSQDDKLPDDLENLTDEQLTSFGSKPEDVAATMLALYLPKFKAGVDKLSSRQLKRLVKALVDPEAPFKYVAPNSVEKQAYIVGTRLIEAKFLALMYLGAQEMEKQNTKEKENERTEKTET